MKSLCYIFFMLIMVYGCYDDKGNYDYKELDELSTVCLQSLIPGFSGRNCRLLRL